MPPRLGLIKELFKEGRKVRLVDTSLLWMLSLVLRQDRTPRLLQGAEHTHIKWLKLVGGVRRQADECDVISPASFDHGHRDVRRQVVAQEDSLSLLPFQNGQHEVKKPALEQAAVKPAAF
jgi:hypothetical protein